MKKNIHKKWRLGATVIIAAAVLWVGLPAFAGPLSGGQSIYPYSGSDLKILMDYDSGTDPIYIGQAAPGTAVSAAGWQIRKLTYDVNGNVTAVSFAGGTNEYNQVWDDRAGLSYN